MSNSRSLRIRTAVGESAPNVVNVSLTQTYDSFEILSLKLNQDNVYNLYQSNYGVIVGRVNASGNFGVPNAKVSVFIPMRDGESIMRKVLYNYKTLHTHGEDGRRYNLLPSEVVNACYQNVGTFPDKRFVLDNKDLIEIFDDYWKYTTVTNASGDYMLFGIPIGHQTIHVDLDLSDIGPLSQRPRDMIYQGFNINQFESPNMFKKSTDLDSLAQIKSQDKGVDVFPFWGDTTRDDGETIGITRCDIQIQYDFQPTCVFMGSVISDSGSKAISKNCICSEGAGKMSEMVTGEGTIEMIRKTTDGKIEEFQIRGNRVIDGDGVWCYQIPMNLDYMMTDEYGNMVPTDDPTKGIPTRTSVRFRISMDEVKGSTVGRKRARYLVPNNPRIGTDNPNFTNNIKMGAEIPIDYEFGSLTSDESFRDLMWNNVYTVKSYIPRLQATDSPKSERYTGIKKIRNHGENNPFPYNNLYLRLGIVFRIICIIIKIYISLIGTLNVFLSVFAGLCTLKIPIINVRPFGFLCGKNYHCMSLPSDICETDSGRAIIYFPQCYGGGANLTNKWLQRESKKSCRDENSGSGVPCGAVPSYDMGELFNCVENNLVEDYDNASFSFSNDWINGTLYFPQWHRRIKPKRKYLFGLITVRAKDDWCSADGYKRALFKKKISPYHSCSVYRGSSSRDKYINEYGKTVIPKYIVNDKNSCKSNCQNDKERLSKRLDKGLIMKKDTFLGTDVFYYAPVVHMNSMPKNENREDVEGVNGDLVFLFATDIVLLGSLNDCDKDGMPQFFKHLEQTTFRMPPSLMTTDGVDVEFEYTEDGKQIPKTTDEDGNQIVVRTEYTGLDWGVANYYDQMSITKKKYWGVVSYQLELSVDSGLFYGVACSSVDTINKTCLNLSRVCELGVKLDENTFIENIEKLKKDNKHDVIPENFYDHMAPDGYISYDEIENFDGRSEFATLNHNGLKVTFDRLSGRYKYDITYLYPHNFDGALRDEMEKTQNNNYMKTKKLGNGDLATYRFNYRLESFSRDYYRFRMGKAPYFYNDGNKFPRYENSFYFYFGLKYGKTAIDKFNSQFFSNCENATEPTFNTNITILPNSWCEDDIQKTGTPKGDNRDGVIAFEFKGISTPYSIYLTDTKNKNSVIEIENNNTEKFYLYSNIDYEQNKHNTHSNDFINRLENLGYVHNEMLVPEYDGSVIKNGVSIPNGTYEVQIVDSNGNTEIETITFMSPILDFDTDESRTFSLPFNHLASQDKFKSGDGSVDYVKIVNDTYNKVSNSLIDREIGGLIVINELFDNNDFIDLNKGNPLKDYKIEIKATRPIGSNIDTIDSFIGGDEGTEKVWGVTLDKGKFTSESGTVYGKYELDKKNQRLIFSVPFAPMLYTIKITMYCGDKLSKNSLVKDLYISEPNPIKLTLNGVDYDLISGNKWDLSSPNKTNNGVLKQGASNTGWFDIQNINNNDSPYNWEKYEPYKDAKILDEELLIHRNTILTKDKVTTEVEEELNGLADKLNSAIKKLNEQTELLNKEVEKLKGELSDDELNSINDKIFEIEGIIDELNQEIEEISPSRDVNGITSGGKYQEIVENFSSNIRKLVEIGIGNETKLQELSIRLYEIDKLSEKFKNTISKLGEGLEVYATIDEIVTVLLEDESPIENNNGSFSIKNIIKDFIDILYECPPRSVRDVKNEVLTKMIEGFVFTDVNEVKSLKLILSGDQQIFPVEYYFKYQEHNSVSDEENYNLDNRYYLSNGVYIENADKFNSQIATVGIPNITTKNNKMYSDKNCTAIKTVNGVDVINARDIKWKVDLDKEVGTRNDTKIYKFGVLAQSGSVVIPDGSVNNKKLIDNMSGSVAFVDKMLRRNMLVWAYHIIPILEPEVYGKLLTKEGMFSCEIINGVANQVEHKRVFDRQTIDDKAIDIVYANYDGSKRMEEPLFVKGIVTEENLDVSDNPFYGYEVDPSNYNGYSQFLPIKKPTLSEFNITQYSDSELNEEIYGGMFVMLDGRSEGIVKIVPPHYIFIFPNIQPVSYSMELKFISNIGGVNVKYYLFPWDNNQHPLETLKDGRFTYPNVGNMFDVDTEEKVIKERSDNFIKNDKSTSWVIPEDGIITNDNYNGEYINFNNKYIVLAISENNCRALSPIYDFSVRFVDLCFVTMVSGDVSSESTYYLGFRTSDKNKNNYLHKYDYVISGESNLREVVNKKEGWSFNGGNIKLLKPDMKNKIALIPLNSSPVDIEVTEPDGDGDNNNNEGGTTVNENYDGKTYWSYVTDSGKNDVAKTQRNIFTNNASHENIMEWVDNNKVFIRDITGLSLQAWLSDVIYEIDIDSDRNVISEKEYHSK